MEHLSLYKLSFFFPVLNPPFSSLSHPLPPRYLSRLFCFYCCVVRSGALPLLDALWEEDSRQKERLAKRMERMRREEKETKGQQGESRTAKGKTSFLAAWHYLSTERSRVAGSACCGWSRALFFSSYLFFFIPLSFSLWIFLSRPRSASVPFCLVSFFSF